MKQKGIVVVITLIVIGIVGSIGLLFLKGNSTPQVSPDQDTTSSKKDPSGVREAPDSNISSTRYIEYKSGVLDESKNKRRVLYFYANWCPTCKPADANFKANQSKIPEDALVIRVNYNDSDTDAEEKELAKKYGITYQHTFVQIDADGSEVAKWNGGQIEELLRNIKQS